MIDLEEFLANVSRDVDKALDELIPTETTSPIRLHQAIRWSVFAGGKRIRPSILVAVGRTFGSAAKYLMKSAAAVEMIHTYSLIHDDLPAMDDDDLRRGKATCHKQFGEATAILAGDVLQTLAFKAVAEDEYIDAVTRIRLISLLANASGTPNGMVSGQQLDLDAESKSIEIAELEQIHRQKTGALISAAAYAGAIIGGASETDSASIERFAEKLGLLFQVTDDLLDVTQLTATLGKTAGKDAVREKATYPGHYGIEESRDMAFSIYQEACRELSTIENDTELLQKLAEFVVGRSN